MQHAGILIKTNRKTLSVNFVLSNNYLFFALNVKRCQVRFFNKTHLKMDFRETIQNTMSNSLNNLFNILIISKQRKSENTSTIFKDLLLGGFQPHLARRILRSTSFNSTIPLFKLWLSACFFLLRKVLSNNVTHGSLVIFSRTLH